MRAALSPARHWVPHKLFFDLDVWRWLRLHAADRETKLSTIVNEVLRSHLAPIDTVKKSA
jgi:hypothetical protein